MTISKVAYSAMARGDAQEFEQLLARHPDQLLVEPTGRVLMYHAVGRGQLACVEALVRYGIDVNVREDEEPEGPIMHAAAKGHLHMVRWLLDHGAKINHHIDGKIRCAALTAAIVGGHFDVVKLLVERGADVNATGGGMPPLGYAKTYNHPKIAEYLRTAGAKDSADFG